MTLQENVWVALPLVDAWALLTDLRRALSCLPDVRIDGVVDGECRGALQLGSGAACARYAGTAYFIERDEIDHRAIVQVHGDEEGGSGTVAGTVTLTLRAEDTGTRIDMATELALAGGATRLEASQSAHGGASVLQSLASGLESGVHPTPATAVTSPRTPTDAEADAPGAFVQRFRRSTVPVACIIAGGMVGYLIGHRRR